MKYFLVAITLLVFTIILMFNSTIIPIYGWRAKFQKTSVSYSM